MAAITISNLRISPYTQKNTIKPVYGDTLTLTFTLPEPFVDGDDYILALDYERVLVPTARPLCAMTSEFTIDGGDITFALEIRTARFRDWVSTIKKPMPVWLQIQRKRDGIYDTILLDDVLALPSVADGDNTVFPGDPLEELLDGKLDKPAKDGSTGDLLKRGADGKPVWAKGGGGGSQAQANWDESDSSEPSYIKNKPPMDYAPAPLTSTTDPTASTVGKLTQFLHNTASGKVWQCVGIDATDPQNVVYAWEQYIPSSAKGAANGVAQLDENGKVPSGELPRASASALGIVQTDSQGGTEIESGRIQLVGALNSDIDAKTNLRRPITAGRLNYAVRSVLPNVTVIPAATTEYSLVDASATTNNHSWQYFHAPAEASTYTFPAVTDTTVAHRIKLTLDFTTVQTYSFEDSEGTAIVPLFTPTLAAGDVYEFDCEYSAVKAQWLVWPHKQGAVSDDYVMQSQVGAANGVAGLDENGLVPEGELPIAGSNKLGLVKGGGNIVSILGDGTVNATSANNAQINGRGSNIITPSNLNYAVTAALTDANHLTMTAAQQATAQSVLGAAPAALHGSGAPTTSTVGVIGQGYVDDDTQKKYTCTAVNVDETDPQNPVTTYTWTDDINAMGGTFNGDVRVRKNLAITSSSSNPTSRSSLSVGLNALASGDYSMAVGYSAKTTEEGEISLGYDGDNHGRYCTNWPAGYLNRRTIGMSYAESALYLRGYYQQGIATIPSATSVYLFTEGGFRHSPLAASTYTLPAIAAVIVVDYTLFQRNTRLDGTGYYSWVNGNTWRYTASPTPAIGDNTYTNTALIYGAKAITAIDERTHHITLNVYFRGYARSTDDDSGSAYAWKDGTDLLYTDTDTPTATETTVYSDTALTTSVGTVALYESSMIALAASAAFEDAAGNDIVPRSTPTIHPGTVVQYLCEWEPCTSQWVIMPIPMVDGGAA